MATKASNLTLFSGGIDTLGAINLANYGGGGGGGGGTYEVTEFTDIAGQSTIASVYDVGLVQVLVNGVQLAAVDYVATNGTTIVLAEAVALADDIVTVIRVGSVGGGGSGGSEHYDSESEPSSPTVGATWRIPSTGIVYKRVDDSGNVIWLDISTASGLAAISSRSDYIATAGQTVFAADYSVGDVDVFLNGVRLVPISDYAATDGTSVTLTTGANVGDEVYVLGFTVFQLIDAVAQADFDSQLLLKANQSTTYTKTEVDDQVVLKANQSTTYTKTEVDDQVVLKANQSTTYTKTEVDTLVSTQINYYEQAAAPVSAPSGTIWIDTDTGIRAMLFIDTGVDVWMEF